LKNALHELLTQKIEEEQREQMNKSTVGKVLDSAVEIFLRVGARMADRGQTGRDLFRNEILIIKEKQALQIEENQPIDEAIDQEAEVELLKPEKLIERFNHLLLSQAKGESISSQNIEDPDAWIPMDVNQKQCILTILQNPKYAELISYQEVCRAFRALGIPEGRPSNK